MRDGVHARLSSSRLVAHWLEVKDVLFHFGSAVVMPDAESKDELASIEDDHETGLWVIRAAYVQAVDHPDQKLLIAGHTDTSGTASDNEGLSKLRAANVLHLLLGEKDAWVAIADRHHAGDDIKHILRWMARWKEWPCHTDSTGNGLDASTKEAIEAFQSEFGKHESGYAIQVDGELGEETWGAIFQMYVERVAELCGTDVAGLEELRGHLRWLYADHKSIGCGEYHPIDMPGRDGFKSQKNRRVELLFYDPDEEPLKGPSGDVCHAGGAGGSGDCPIYNSTIYKYECIAPETPKESDEPPLEIEGPDTVVVGESASYRITKGRRSAGKKPKWFVDVEYPGRTESIDSSKDARFVISDDRLTIQKVPGPWSNRSIRVYISPKKAGEKTSVLSKVKWHPKVVADSWSKPDPARGLPLQRPGVGRDFTSGDYTEEQYKAMGPLFYRDSGTGAVVESVLDALTSPIVPHPTKPPALLTRSDLELFEIFRAMAQGLFTTADLASNTDAIIENFRANRGATYSNPILTAKAKEHPSTRRFIGTFSGELRKALNDVGKDAGRIPERGIARYPSPAFSTATDKITGLTIAVNDTWAYQVEIVDYEVNGNSHRFRARVTLFDHFGLDPADLIGKPHLQALDGFRAWFILQHVRGYKPFITEMAFEEVLEFNP